MPALRIEGDSFALFIIFGGYRGGTERNIVGGVLGAHSTGSRIIRNGLFNEAVFGHWAKIDVQVRVLRDQEHSKASNIKQKNFV